VESFVKQYKADINNEKFPVKEFESRQ